MVSLSRLYAILDASCFAEADALLDAAEELLAARVSLIQYRNKFGATRMALNQAQELRKRCVQAGAGATTRLVMNDRADLCLAAGFDALHLGQDDLFPESARKIIGPNRWLGVSTHNPQQVSDANETSADYIAIGPVFATASKANPDPVIGLEGIRQARGLTRKPLVAIGGISRENCRSVIDAGADSVAVISDLVNQPRKSAEEFLRILE